MEEKQNEPNGKPKPKTKTKSVAAVSKTTEAKPKQRPRKKLVPQRLPEKLEQIRLANALTRQRGR